MPRPYFLEHKLGAVAFGGCRGIALPILRAVGEGAGLAAMSGLPARTIEYERAGVPKAAGYVSAATSDFVYQRPINASLYVHPPHCDDESCLNFGRPGRPIDTYFLCASCRKAAPDAYTAGYARLPLNWRKMKRAERDEWRRKTNATVFTVMLKMERLLPAPTATAPPASGAPAPSLPPNL